MKSDFEGKVRCNNAYDSVLEISPLISVVKPYWTEIKNFEAGVF